MTKISLVSKGALAGAVATVVLAATVALAATGSSATAASLAGPLPVGWTHAAINYYANDGAHTLVLDRGRVTAASDASLTLLEHDGTSVEVALDASTRVTVDGRPGQLSDIRPGVTAITRTIDGGAARLVSVHVPTRLARLSRRR